MKNSDLPWRSISDVAVAIAVAAVLVALHAAMLASPISAADAAWNLV